MKLNFQYIKIILLFLGVVFVSETVRAQYTIPKKPSKKEQTSLYDELNLLSTSQQNALKNKLLNYADSTSTQIVVAIIATTKGEDISLLGAKWGQKWGIGQADKDNGILVLLAKDDRMVDINTGYGIETIVTDRMAEQIINREMIPYFKSGDYYSGLDKGTNALIDALAGNYKENRSFKKEGDSTGFIIAVIIFFIIIIILRSRNGGRNGGGGTGSLLDVIILSNMGRTGGFGGSSGGGSFGGGSFGGGFGGGGFGGGGASGGW
jgi:uncharacterized protein